MPQYMMILHESTTAPEGLSPVEIQRIIARYQQWSARVAQAGKLVGGNKLRDDGGRHLTTDGSKGLQVRDGAFAELTEIIGGYYIVQAQSYDEAITLCSDCPHLALGGRIELREVEVVT